MAQMDMFHNINPGNAILLDNYQAGIALDDALTVDTQGYESVTFILNTGEEGTGDFEITVYDSDVDETASYEQVTNSAVGTPLLINLLGTEELPDDAGDGLAFSGDVNFYSMFKFAYIGKKRYLRLVLVAENGPDLDFGVMALMGNPNQAPTRDIPTTVNP